jgi:hypothetical protein
MARLINDVVAPVGVGMLAAGVVLGLVVPVAAPDLGPRAATGIAVAVVVATLTLWHVIVRQRRRRLTRR